MSSERLRIAAVLAGLIALTGCPGTLNDRAAFEVEAGEAGSTCDDVPVVVFMPRCGLSTCHSASMPANGLDLVSPDVYTRLAGKAATGGPGVLVDPGGDPSKSVLYLKLTSSPPFGSQMPLTGTKLDATTLACVATWIATRGSIDGGAPATDSGESTDGEGADVDTGPMDAGMTKDSTVPDSTTMPEATMPEATTMPDSTTMPEATTMPDTGTMPEGSTAQDGSTDATAD